MFLYTVAIFLRSRRMAETNDFLSQKYYLGEVAPDRREPMVDFSVFNEQANSLDHRNQRLGLRRLSLRADLIEKRSHGTAVPFGSLMQADFVLFLRDHLTRAGEWRRWWPNTLVFAVRMYDRPFELFARAESRCFFV